MDDSKRLIEQLRCDIKIKIGKSLDTPTDFDFLSNDIQNTLKEYISPTTLKRFYNYIPNNVIPRISTLNVLARYIGKTGWKEYCESLVEGESQSNIELIKIKNNYIIRSNFTKREKYFLFTIIITAVISSLLSFYGGYYLNKIQIYNNRTISSLVDDGGSIKTYDTLSKLVISQASHNCNIFADTLRLPGCCKGKIVFLNKFHKKHKVGRDSYPIEILDKFVSQNSPEYNLYKTSLIQLSEQVYKGFYERNVDSLKIALKKK